MKKIVLIVIASIFFINTSCKKDKSEPKVDKSTEVRQWKPEDTRSLTGIFEKRGVIVNTQDDTAGYVLYEPSLSTFTYLMDKEGSIVHTWESDLNSLDSYLMPNGHLFRLERDENFPTFAVGGQAGRLREYDWDGNIVWDFKYFNEKELLHHDFEILPNGNILAISFDAKTREEAIAAGRDPEHISKSGIWLDKIVEIKPMRPSGGEIIWEWTMWDHLIQDIDSSKGNYGVLSDTPRKININVQGGKAGRSALRAEHIEQLIKDGLMTSNATVDNQGANITHMNAIDYNAELDQIVVSVRMYNEIFIIDHSTTIEEAKGSSGGKWGHGGDLLYRWGNPKNYGRGNDESQKLFGQHDVEWISKNYPGEGHLLVFNNEMPSPESKFPKAKVAPRIELPEVKAALKDVSDYSAVYEFIPPVNEKKEYIMPATAAIGPESPSWSYMAPDKYSFYSSFFSGAQRLKNGNTFITDGVKGRFFEVNPDGEILWEYWMPYVHHYKLPDGTSAQPGGPFIYGVFRSTLYTKDYDALNDKNLKPIVPQPEPFIFKMPLPLPQN